MPTSLRKVKTFLQDEYLREITAASDDRYFYFQAKCCNSFRKNDPPYQLKLALCIFKGDVLDSSCTCVAGKAGFCNHISALMIKIWKYSLFEAKTNKDLWEELQNTRPRLRDINIVLPWSRSRDDTHEFQIEKLAKKYFKRNKVDGVGIELVLLQSRTHVVKKKKYERGIELVLPQSLIPAVGKKRNS